MSGNGKVNVAEQKLIIPETPPFGLTVLFAKKGQGKTLAAINSPWEPVHVIDVEGSSADYYKHQDRLIDAGVLKHRFTRDDCPTFETFGAAFKRIAVGEQKYGTLVIDTGGQFTQWVGDDIFYKNADKVEKQVQLVWGKVRDSLRNAVLKLQSKTKLVVVTAHEREYHKVYSPRLNPAIVELAALSVRLVRDPNKQIPAGYITASRLPFFPPVIQNFTIESLLNYFEQPADWNNLTEDQLQPPEPETNITAEEMEDM